MSSDRNSNEITLETPTETVASSPPFAYNISQSNESETETAYSSSSSVDIYYSVTDSSDTDYTINYSSESEYESTNTETDFSFAFPQCFTEISDNEDSASCTITAWKKISNPPSAYPVLNSVDGIGSPSTISASEETIPPSMLPIPMDVDDGNDNNQCPLASCADTLVSPTHPSASSTHH